MALLPATESHLRELMTWFPDARSLATWGGPHYRFPFTEASFRADARWAEIASYSLIEGAGELSGFGQYYPRAGRCHLARLAIAPGLRGGGLGERLVRRLAAVGCAELPAEECSLFVMANNTPAVRLYEKLGFETTSDPEGFELEGCVYQVAPRSSVVGEVVG